MNLLRNVRARWADSALAWVLFGDRETSESAEEPAEQAPPSPFALERPAITARQISPRVPVETITYLVGADGELMLQSEAVYDARAMFMWWAMEFDACFTCVVERLKGFARQALLDKRLLMTGQLSAAELVLVIRDRARITALRVPLLT